MSTAMYVASIVVGVLALLALILIPVIVWLRRRNRVVAEQLATEIAGEAVVRAPEKGSYRGATAPGYPAVKNTGLIALTKRRLVFRTLTGKVATAAGEIGFYVFSGIADWISALSTSTPGQSPSP